MDLFQWYIPSAVLRKGRGDFSLIAASGWFGWIFVTPVLSAMVLGFEMLAFRDEN